MCINIDRLGGILPMMTDSHSAATPSHSHKDYYHALHQAALTITSSLELDQVLESVVISITEAMQVKGCILRLFDPRTGQLQLSAGYGLSGSYLRSEERRVGKECRSHG